MFLQRFETKQDCSQCMCLRACVRRECCIVYSVQAPVQLVSTGHQIAIVLLVLLNRRNVSVWVCLVFHIHCSLTHTATHRPDTHACPHCGEYAFPEMSAHPHHALLHLPIQDHTDTLIYWTGTLMSKCLQIFSVSVAKKKKLLTLMVYGAPQWSRAATTWLPVNLNGSVVWLVITPRTCK